MQDLAIRDYITRPDAWTDRMVAIKSKLDKYKICSILDIGCGQGELSSLFPGVDYLGVDNVDLTGQTLVLDLDEEFLLDRDFHFAFGLGIFEYLKNPLPLFFSLASRVQYLVLSFVNNHPPFCRTTSSLLYMLDKSGWNLVENFPIGVNGSHKQVGLICDKKVKHV